MKADRRAPEPAQDDLDLESNPVLEMHHIGVMPTKVDDMLPIPSKTKTPGPKPQCTPARKPRRSSARNRHPVSCWRRYWYVVAAVSVALVLVAAVVLYFAVFRSDDGSSTEVADVGLTTISQSVSMDISSSDFIGLQSSLELGYGLSIGIVDNATMTYTDGSSVTATASRRALIVEFTATVLETSEVATNVETVAETITPTSLIAEVQQAVTKMQQITGIILNVSVPSPARLAVRRPAIRITRIRRTRAPTWSPTAAVRPVPTGPRIPIGGLGTSGTWVIRRYRSLFITLGETVVFKYPANTHDVMLMKDLRSQRSCDFQNAIQLGSRTDGTGAGFLWTPRTTGLYHISCNVGSHCHMGQRVTVVVKPVPLPTQTPTRAPTLPPVPPTPNPTFVPSSAPTATPTLAGVAAVFHGSAARCNATSLCSCSGNYSLPASDANSLKRIVQMNTGPVSLARSYQGQDWEDTGYHVSRVWCTAGSCVIQFATIQQQSGCTFMMDVRQQATPISGEASAARFLLQTTFGPKMSEVAALSSSFTRRSSDHQAAARTWIQAQTLVAVTSHREYYRERTNPRVVGDAIPVGGIREACSVGSRWHTWAFTRLDTGKFIVHTPRAHNRSLLTVDGITRTETLGSSFVHLPLAVDSCSASTTFAGWPCSSALYSSGPGWAMDLINGQVNSVGQWIKAVFNRNYTLTHMAYQNRGSPRDVKDLTLRFKDNSTQSVTIKKWSWTISPETCRSVAWDAGPTRSCLQRLEDVVTDWVMITVDSVWPVVRNGNHKSDFNCMGASNIKFWGHDNATLNSIKSSGGFKICSVQEGNGATMTVGSDCSGLMKQPPIWFSSTPESNPLATFQTLDSAGVTMQALSWMSGASIMTSRSAPCVANSTFTFVRVSSDPQGQYHKFDPSLYLLKNTIADPANVAATATEKCPTVPKTYQNKDSCVRRASCMPIKFNPSVILTLTESNIRQWYLKSARCVYYVTGLVLQANTYNSAYGQAPCKNKLISRWKKYPGSCADASLTITANSETTTLVANALAVSGDTNPYVRDIMLKSSGISGTCTNVMGMVAEVSGVCWQHVHPDEYEVIDFSFWAQAHEGNGIALSNGRPNPIKRFAELGSANLRFPSDKGHDDSRWTRFFGGHYSPPQKLGRLGDTVVFNDLPETVKTTEVAAYFHADVVSREAGHFEACGSTGEVENDPSKGRLFLMTLSQHGTGPSNQYVSYGGRDGRKVVWANVVFEAPDQLRQRVAWALAQIWTCASVGPGHSYTEHWSNFYDIFTRNAFGYARDILKAIAYSPLMGDFLTYRNNKGLVSGGTFPDENMAREMMQLFSIGLYQLHPDGRPELDADGNQIPTYSNEHVMSFARVWTGFAQQPKRPNIEHSPHIGNGVDPMQIKSANKDAFPKPNLYGGFIGDTYPLCADLPSRMFLKKGAKYKLLGTNSGEPASYDAPHAGPRMIPSNTSSPLYTKLCNAVAGVCTFPSEVTLDANIACDGQECNVDTVAILKLYVGNQATFYQYVKPACVYHSFYSNAKTATQFKYPNTNVRQCADPQLPSAGAACCTSSDPNFALDMGSCVYKQELVTYRTMLSRCAAQSKAACDFTAAGLTKFGYYCALNYRTPAAVHSCPQDAPVCTGHVSGSSWGHCTTSNGHPAQSCETFRDGALAWTNAPCTLQVQINSEGMIYIIHHGSTVTALQANSGKNVPIMVNWNTTGYPRAGASCNALPGCTSRSQDCLCNVTETTSAVFTDHLNVPLLAEVKARLRIGAPALDTFDAGAYTKCVTAACNARSDVEVFLNSSAAGVGGFDQTTIFKIQNHGRTMYLYNKASTVSVGGGYSFGNPVSFMRSVVESTVEEAEYEMDAYLDHLFYHKNFGPFVSYRMIQRLVTSNPSPRYMRAVVDAFSSGTYDGMTFSGQYGDLKAAVYAIFLDQEARSSVLDEDPTSGHLREPILKLLHAMRSLEYKKADNQLIQFRSLEQKIGQEFSMQPSVFGFYQPEFTPDGPVANAGLVAPEAQLGTAPFNIGFLQGMTEFAKAGLKSTNKGFGPGIVTGVFNYSAAGLSTDTVMHQLDILLTGGRLNNISQAVIRSAYDGASNQAAALQDALTLMFATSEFHMTNMARLADSLRPVKPPQASGGRPYKAIIMLFFNGGADTYNLLMPHSECTGADLNAEYNTIRSTGALSKAEMRQIVTDTPNPCRTYGIHPQMKVLQDLYNDGDATILTNMGAMVEPVTKAEFKAKSKKVPKGLFGHFEMQKNAANLHAQDASAKGVGGRMMTALGKQSNPFKREMYSISGNQKFFEGGPAAADIIDPWSADGVVRYGYYSKYGEKIEQVLTDRKPESLMGHAITDQIVTALNRTESLGQIIERATVDTTFPTMRVFNNDQKSKIALQSKLVSRIVKARTELQTERDIFFVLQGGYDTHHDMKDSTNSLFADLNAALTATVTELKAQGIWDNTVIVSASDFSRTLTSNGRGTDHGWGGHYFLLGGKVKQQILGTYPSMTEDSDHNLGRGRMLPTLPWESVWSGVAEWFGVEPSRLSEVLPNLANFPSGSKFSKAQLFDP